MSDLGLRYLNVRTSRALTLFTRGAELPYVSDDRVSVTAAKTRDGLWGSSVKQSRQHLIEAAATAWEAGGPVLGARWLCGGGSTGVALTVPADYMAMFGTAYRTMDPDHVVCAKCLAVRDGEHPGWVYRVFDGSGARLLYIGSTGDWSKRRTQHRTTTWWWSLAKDVRLTKYPTLALAREAEVEAIRAERPRMNIQHNDGEVSA